MAAKTNNEWGFTLPESIYRMTELLTQKSRKNVIFACAVLFFDGEETTLSQNEKKAFDAVKGRVIAAREHSLNKRKSVASSDGKTLDVMPSESAVLLPTETPLLMPSETPSVMPIDREREKEEEKEEERVGVLHTRKTLSFHPPTYDELSDYVTSEGLNVDVMRFIDYFSASGWKLSNGNAMKDWKAAARNWSRSENKKAPKEVATNERFAAYD